MSRRNKKTETNLPANPADVEAYVRVSAGRTMYPYCETPPARRLRCDACKKTWKFSDALNHSPCPRCKKGRLS